MEDLLLTVVRDIAIGTPVATAIDKFLALDSAYLTNVPPPDVEDQNIFMRKLHHSHIIFKFYTSVWRRQTISSTVKSLHLCAKDCGPNLFRWTYRRYHAGEPSPPL
jgi:hypothetical protein